MINFDGILYLARSAEISARKLSSSKVLPALSFMHAQTSSPKRIGIQNFYLNVFDGTADGVQKMFVGVVVVRYADGCHFAQAVARQEMIVRHIFAEHFYLRFGARCAADNCTTQGRQFFRVEIFVVDERD